MNALRDLSAYRARLAACVRCGACQAVCPTYRETGRESTVARGKIELAAEILAGHMTLDEDNRRAFAACLLCGACTAACPNRVPTAAIVAALRRESGMAGHSSSVSRGVAALTGHPRLTRRLFGSARLLAPFFLKKVPETSGLRLRFTGQALRNRVLPPLPKKSLFDLVPERLPGQPGKPTVAFFAGCSISYLYPDIGLAAIQLLHRLGYTVLLPQSQACCGMPATSSGRGALAAELMQINSQAFSGADTVITACASCGGMLGHLYAEEGDETARQLAARVKDIHLFLQEEGQLAAFAALPRWREQPQVCWHDPCHLKNHGITEAPRALLRALPNVDFTDQAGAALCCGLGGTFALTQAALSRKIADRKAAALATSAAHGTALVATGCPGCLLQLSHIIHMEGLSLQAAHSISLAWAALEQAQADAIQP